jgi:mono/diheme cytochrome c family protein
MRTKLNCLFAAVGVVAGCGGVEEAAAPVAAPPVAAIIPATCDTPAPVAPLNQSVSRLSGGKKFTVSVQGSLAGLKFEWRSTDGKVIDVDAPTTTWQAPEGPGLHFVYVLAKNGKGGYTQRRIAISTEGEFGVAPVASAAPRDYAPPPAPAVNCFQFRSYVRTQEFFGRGTSSGLIDQGAGKQPLSVGGDAINLPDVQLFAEEAVPADPNNPAVPVLIATTDLRGSFNIDHAPPGDFDKPNVGNRIITARLNAGEKQVALGVNIDETRPEANNDTFGQPLGVTEPITGRVLLAGNTTQACGIVDEFFGKEVSGTATLVDAAGKELAKRRLSDKGHYAFPQIAGAAKIRLQCEGSAIKEIVANTKAPLTIITDSTPPNITGMTAVVEGGSANVGIFLTPFSGGQSNQIADASVFLAYKGIDNALSTCMYYRSIGAVKDCGLKGELIGAITHDDWYKKVGLGKFVRDGKKPAAAKFINKVDLNLSRDHVGISYKVGEAAMEVCNYLGAADDLESAIKNDPELARAAIDAAVDGMVAQKNLVACVSMDHTSTPGVNGGQPFTNFLIFGASGELLPRINLDGRSEKWVPGTCIICHGSDRYAGRFPTDGTGLPDIGTHLLPFIPTNYNYSSKVGLRRQDQETAMFDLNQIVAQAGATIAVKEALTGTAGWYGTGKVFNNNYLPPSWANKSQADKDFYQKVYFQDCLGCHVNAPERLNFDHYENLVQGSRNTITSLNVTMCGGGNVTTSSAYVRNLAMPNALRTFDLLWGTQGRTDVPIDKMAVTAKFINQYLPDVTSCKLTQTPLR